MKEVVKVSIGQWAFSVEQQAYEFLQAYLDALKTQGQDLDAVEESLGKYLSSQVKNVSQVVTMEHLRQAISALGLTAPDDFSAPSGKDFVNDFSERLQEKMHKHRLYRHPEQKVLGGVFGGWAAYLSWDPAALRILYAIFLLVFLFAESIVGPILFLAYFVMWVAMPLADSTDQLGEIPSRAAHKGNQVVNEISQEVRQSPFGRFLSEFFRITFGIIFFLVGMTGLVVLPMCFFWLIPVDLHDILAFMPIVSTVGFSKVLFYICLFIPFLIFFYEGIKLLFNLRIKKLRLGLVMFVFWLLSFIVLSFTSLNAIGLVGKSHIQLSNQYPVEQQQDTLVITIDESQISEDAYVCIFDESMYFLWDDPEDNATLYSLPSIKIHRGEQWDDINIKTSYHSCLRKANFELLTDHRNMMEMENGQLKIYPCLYTEQRPWNLSYCKIDIYIPENMTVLMDYSDNSKDLFLKENKRYFPYRGYAYDIDDDVDISTIGGNIYSSFDFFWD